MALPKRKYAKARQGKRRSHLGIDEPAFISCPKCHSVMLPHHVCQTCGSYAGRQAIEIEGPKKKAE